MMNQEKKQIVDYNLHNIVKIRLLNPTLSDEKSFDGFLGDYKKSFVGEPDITIKYNAKLFFENLTYIGLNYAGYNNEGFYILSNGRHNIKVKIPFEKIGKNCIIECESGIKGIPLLNQVISLTFMSKGYVPVHASAFLFEGSGVLVMGWSKGGKTESLLSFALKGAKYVGDEIVFISGDGSKMFGIPVSVCIWEWQFEQIKSLLPKIRGQKKILFANIHLLEGIYRIFNNSVFKNTYPIKMIGEVLPSFQKQLNIRVTPIKIFNNYIRNELTAIDKIILVFSHASDEIKIEQIDSIELISRMINSHEYEFDTFIQFYRTFKFAFPHLINELLENLNSTQAKLLSKAMEGKEVYKVSHPYPISFEKLFLEMKNIFTSSSISSVKPEQKVL